MEVYTVWEQASREVYVLADSPDSAVMLVRERNLFEEIEWEAWNGGATRTLPGELDEDYGLIWDDEDGWMSPSEVPLAP